MNFRVWIIVGLAAAVIGLASNGTCAAPLMHDPAAAAAGEGKPVETVQWRYCAMVRNQCAFRWGPWGWRYARCVARRGCA